MAAIPGNTANSAKNATLPEVERMRLAEIDQSTRQKMSFHPRAGICSGLVASRPRPISRERTRSSEGSEPFLFPTSARQSSPCSEAFSPTMSPKGLRPACPGEGAEGSLSAEAAADAAPMAYHSCAVTIRDAEKRPPPNILSRYDPFGHPSRYPVYDPSRVRNEQGINR